ncbi:DUF262 domain-containing protein [uncultured Fluviicola sp.]|uniref:DUF262 domain-containing protein n=1 Tax=uncultured Fluviicola sp. TaxID=463303 RepID=UPI0025E16C13|nr:DUF262 domain-containing protein [uncultured Fluviicola sp.]
MQTNNQDIKNLTIKELFTGSDKYLIPIYQRNYEWEDKQIIQLIEDIKDYYIEEEDKQYYIGTLVVNRRLESKEPLYETIDGQQRLTTFNLLICALKALAMENKIPESVNDFLSKTIIHFESRPISEKTIEFVFNNGSDKPNFTDFNDNIIAGNRVLYNQLKQLEEQFSSIRKEVSWKSKTFEGFLNYLFHKVIIVRVQVPLDTDLNHYFEIMNSRGEQLEKHEILKSRMMKELNNCSNAKVIRRQFNMIWEACSQMDTYVQLLFPKELRMKLFGDRWFQFVPESSEQMFQLMDSSSSVFKTENEGISFSDIVNTKDLSVLTKKIEQLQDENIINESDSKQYQPIINFENFLLHTLKLTNPDFSVSLDDKRLLSFFKITLEKAKDKEQFVKEFAYQLLKNKFLLDQYVIKRKYLVGEDFWSLEVLKFYPKVENVRDKESYNYVNLYSDKNKNDELILLLSMFHVSIPTQVYKYWLFEALKFLNEVYSFHANKKGLENPENVHFENYADFLRSVAIKFLKYRFLNGEQELSYDELLYDNLEEKNESFNLDLLSYGQIRNNLVFNYIDYLLWQINKEEYKEFEFSFRSSVEHYYPQNPISGDRIEDDSVLNCIGNLCLISHSNNSKLSNYLPMSKREHYTKSQSKDSIKQMEMMKFDKSWSVDEIKVHNQSIVELLKQSLL